jgi:hypothetical protein
MKFSSAVTIKCAIVINVNIELAIESNVEKALKRLYVDGDPDCFVPAFVKHTTTELCYWYRNRKIHFSF